jgi:quinoprotein glucose dehydrogenase
MAGSNAGRFEAVPIFVDGTLFLSTPLGNVLALDPANGAVRWRFDAKLSLDASYGDFASRGVSTWVDSRLARGAVCHRRIFVAPVDARLIALDAATGKPCRDFGAVGQVDLTVGLRNPPDYKGEYEVTSPPAIFGDLVIVGSAIGDNSRANAPSGVVRAFDARSGIQKWTWDPIPRDAGEEGYDTWQGPVAHNTGAANAWSLISVDAKRGLIFVPVGSASPDFFGGERLGQNLFANSVVALHAATGKVAWHFQAVHHDLWDYDIPSQPVLVTVRRNGSVVDAVVVTTKMGHVFVLDRATGTPVFPIEERPVPASDVQGEKAWPTQPFPVLPAPLTPARLSADDAFGLTPEDRAACKARIAGARSEGIFTPPSLRGTIIYPGNIGGSNWSGAAWDPTRKLLVTPTNNLAFAVTLYPSRFDGGSATSRTGIRDFGTERHTLRDEARCLVFTQRRTVQSTAMGIASGHQPLRRDKTMAVPAWLQPVPQRPSRRKKLGINQPWRRNDYGRRAGVRGGRIRFGAACLRYRNRSRALASEASCRRQRDADDISHRKRKAVRRHLGGRTRQIENAARRLLWLLLH